MAGPVGPGRSPLPGVVPAGTADEVSVLGAVDLFPTLCSLCRVVPPAHASFDGEDLSAVFRGTKTARTNRSGEYGAAPLRRPGRRALYPKEPGAQLVNSAVREGPEAPR